MLIRFYSIEWCKDSEELPSTVILEVEDGTDVAEIEMNGGEMLEDEFGVAVDSYEWEQVEDDTEDPFSFTTDPDEE